jgi:predicted regulator of Ras-like GTPase activity (Roadblock/LC7/MglB family)
MHWLQDRIQKVFRDLEQYSGLKGAQFDTTEPTGIWMAQREARAALLKGLGAVVHEAVTRPGVRAGFVEHDGLVLDWAGDGSSADALAALARTIIRTAREAGQGAPIGPIRQLVIVGADHKLALVTVGEVTLGFFSRAETPLAEALSR